MRANDKKSLMTAARLLGFSVRPTRGGHLRFDLDGAGPIFTSSTPGDRRAWKNCLAQLRRAIREMGNANATHR